MGKLGTSFVALWLGAGTVALLAGTMGLLGPGTVGAAQRLPAPEGAPSVVPWLMNVQPDAAGSGRSVITLRIVRRQVAAPVRDNPTMRIQQQLAPPDLTNGHSGGRAMSARGSGSAALR